METKKTKKTGIAITIALLALASLACFCGGSGGSGAFQEIMEQVQATLQAQSGSVGSGGSGGVVESGYPVYDGGDGYSTTVLQYVGVGGTASGYIDDPSEAHNYLFDASSGQSITVTVLGGADETDTRLVILDPNGGFVTNADDVSGLDPIITFTASMTGVYTARIDTFSEGGYTIYVE